jgi:hypothetical protein
MRDLIPANCYSNEGFDFVQNLTELMTTKAGSYTSDVKIRHRSAIVAIAVDGDWTLMANRDSTFSLFSGSKFKFSIQIFISVVRCCAIKIAFQLAVCGSRDGCLVFCSINRGMVTRTVSLNDNRPNLLLITHSWGFVCVCMTKLFEGELSHIIALYTVNGDLIREIKIEKEVITWSTAQHDGIDYIALALDDGRCYCFEAFYLVLGEPCYSSSIKLVGIAYDPHLKVVAIVDKQGTLTFKTWDIG